MIEINLREIFSKQAFIRTLNSLTPVSSVVVDELYKNVVMVPSPVIPVADLHTDIVAARLSTRGGGYVDLSRLSTVGAKWIEPYPIKLKEPLDGVTLNNLRMMTDSASIEAWRTQKIEKLRQVNRATTEFQAVQALKGKIKMPVITDDGSTAYYEVEYGSTKEFTFTKALNATDVTLADIEKQLLAMAAIVTKSGYGELEFWAGETVWFAIHSLLTDIKNETRVTGKVDGKVITLAAGTVRLRNEEVYNPDTKAWQPTVAADSLVCVAKNAPHTLAYAAIDDLDGKLEALPFFVKPVSDAERGWKLLTESKPLPAPVLRAICWGKNVIA